MKKIIILMALILTLSACSRMETPVGIGYGRDALKKSPCACNTFYDYKRGGFINEQI